MSLNSKTYELPANSSAEWHFRVVTKRSAFRKETSQRRASQLPTYLIGGPGKVIVDLDSVTLFERPDGTPRVIGPTANQQLGRATLQGFERFRQAIDIRDHYADLSVTSRSRDGIPVTATDVHMMFSVHRGGKKATREFPYPFSEKAIEQLIYKSLSKVTPRSN